MDFEQIKTILKDNGVVGAGGAGFPSYAKLNTKADTILLNCAECEPLLTLHQQLLANKTSEILIALEMIAKTLNINNVVVCIKEEYKKTVQAVLHCMKDYDIFDIKQLDSVYPMGDEVVLIHEALGKSVPVGGIPIDIGVIVFNVETIYNAYCAIAQSKPVTQKYVTVTGAVNVPKTVLVPIGTPLGELVELAGGANIEDYAYLVGGPMMGFVGDEWQTVTKTTNALLILPSSHKLITARDLNCAVGINRASAACCQCMMCTDLCPRSNLGYPIKPHLFMRALASGNYESTDTFLNTFFCCGCGICEKFACPQSLSPATLINRFKGELRKAGVNMPKGLQKADENPQREYRSVPENRLEQAIDLARYHSKALLDDTPYAPKVVAINLQQHIGAPLTVLVKEQDSVAVGDIIASAQTGLGTNLHSSVSGIVKKISKTQITIEARG